MLVNGSRFAEALDWQVRCATIAREEIARDHTPGYFDRVAHPSIHPWLGAANEGVPDLFEHGNTFFWTTDAVALLEHAARSIPEWYPVSPHGVPHLPHYQAFHCFERSPRAADGSDLQVDFLAWSPELYNLTDPAREEIHGHRLDWRQYLSADHRLRLDQMVAGDEIGLGWRGLSRADVEQRRLYDSRPIWSFPLSLTEQLSYVTSHELTDGEAEAQAINAWEARLIAAMAVFSAQRVARSATTTPPRPWRRRLPSWWTTPPLVRVIHLSPLTSPGARSEGPVPWSCRWMVRGHWRQQWCPAAQRHDPRWITEYIKGPDGQPLRLPAATVVTL